MLKSHLKNAWRNLVRNKVVSFIHIIGLAIGVSASLVIYLLASYHLNFDTFEKDANRIYRVVSNFN